MTLFVRGPAVAGMFYNADAHELRAEVEGYIQAYRGDTNYPNVAAIIVPHAGYLFSGHIAAAGYAQIPSYGEWDNIFIIGSSHRALFGGASVDRAESYKTPLGSVAVNTDVVDQLIEASTLMDYNPKAHEGEHTIEVQLPFLQCRLKKPFKIVPIVLGTQDAEICAQISQVLKPWFNERNLFVISTDFSHYPKYSEAVSVDKITADAIVKNIPSELIDQLLKNDAAHIKGLDTSLCGWTSVLTLINITTSLNVKYHLIKYQNSGDVPQGDKSRVVGYNALVVCRDSENIDLTLTENEKQQLLERAKRSVAAAVLNHKLEHSSQTGVMNLKAGAFVTLYKNGKLRGCIGQFPGDQPLGTVIDEAARSSALHDHRFSPVLVDEIPDISVELSVITPLRKINSEKEIVLGKHGIYIRKGMQGGTFLPQVATETGWSLEEFLGHCARDKAGIGWDGWKNADLYVYEAIVIK